MSTSFSVLSHSLSLSCKYVGQLNYLQITCLLQIKALLFLVQTSVLSIKVHLHQGW